MRRTLPGTSWSALDVSLILLGGALVAIGAASLGAGAAPALAGLMALSGLAAVLGGVAAGATLRGRLGQAMVALIVAAALFAGGMAVLKINVHPWLGRAALGFALVALIQAALFVGTSPRRRRGPPAPARVDGRGLRARAWPFEHRREGGASTRRLPTRPQ